MQIALVRSVSPTISECALSFIERQPIDYEAAQRQHAAYEDQLRALGLEVIAVPAQPQMPDAVFVEDTAVVVDELAVMTAPALDSRRCEVESMAAVLGAYRPLQWINGRGRLEGGDVMRIDRTLYVGLSRRTNEDGARQLADALAPHGYRVRPVEVKGCLHLKTACTYVGRNTLLANANWGDVGAFAEHEVITVPPSEPEAGNALLVGDTVIVPSNFPLTRRLLEDRGFPVVTVDISELQKAEAGLTCCSVIFTGKAV